jgi:hypothetical protein
MKKFREAVQAKKATHARLLKENLKEPLTETEAAGRLGRSTETVKGLRAADILIPTIQTVAGGKPAFHHLPADLDALKPCLETSDRLLRDGVAKPLKGELWVLQCTGETDEGKPIYEAKDLTANFGNLRTIASASKKFKIPESRLKNAIRKWLKAKKDGSLEAKTSGLLEVEKLYGVVRFALLDCNVEQFKRDTKPTTASEPGKWATRNSLCDKVGAEERNDRQEVFGCAKFWAKGKLLPHRKITAERIGSAPAKYEKGQNGKRRAVEYKATRKIINTFEYDIATFEKLWAIDQYIDAVRKLLRAGDLSSNDLKTELCTLGLPLPDIRFRNAVCEAGAILMNKRPGTPGVYHLTNRGPLEPAKRGTVDEAMAFLAKRLANGPLLCNVLDPKAEHNKNTLRKAYVLLHLKAANPNASSKSLRNLVAEKYAETLKRKSYKFIPERDTDGRLRGRLVFWYLPDQKQPTDEEATRIVEDYRKAKPQAADHRGGQRQRPAGSRRNAQPKKTAGTKEGLAQPGNRKAKTENARRLGPRGLWR